MLVKRSTTEFEFRDPGTIGFNNPTHLARREANRLWKGAKIGTIVSLGTGLVALTPPNPTSAFESVVSKSLPQLTTSDMHIKSTIKRLSSNAVDSERVHDRTLEELTYGCVIMSRNSEISRIDFGPYRGIYYRINPSLGFSGADLLDICHESHVEDSIAKWLDTPEQKQIIQEIANKLYRVRQTSITSLPLLGMMAMSQKADQDDSLPSRSAGGLQSPGVEADGFLHI